MNVIISGINQRVDGVWPLAQPLSETEERFFENTTGVSFTSPDATYEDVKAGIAAVALRRANRRRKFDTASVNMLREHATRIELAR